MGHLFLARDDPSHWHFLYLDQRDIAASGNHWTEGPHVHFVNWLWPGHSADSVWKAFRSGQTPGGALHIRFRADRLPEPTD